MSGSVSVEPDPTHPAGHAVIRVHGAGQLGRSTDFRIKRDDYDEGVFGRNGWQVSDEFLTPDTQSVEGDDLLLHIGPSVVQHVVSGVYHLAVPGAGVDATVFWPDLPLLSDEALNMVAEPARKMVAEPARAAPRAPSSLRPPTQRSSPDAVQSAGPKAAETLQADDPRPADPVAVTPLPAGSPRPPTTDASEPRRWLPWAIPLLLLLIAAGGGYFGYRWLYPPSPEVAQTSPPGTQAAPPPGPVTPEPARGLDLTHMSAADALSSGAPPEMLLREAERRMQLGGDQRNEALLLMQGAADANRNYAPAHAALGRLYDPNLQHPPEIQSDARQAAIHYRGAVQGGDGSVADARAALKAWLEQRSQRGDLYAPLILKDFWP